MRHFCGRGLFLGLGDGGYVYEGKKKMQGSGPFLFFFRKMFVRASLRGDMFWLAFVWHLFGMCLAVVGGSGSGRRWSRGTRYQFAKWTGSMRLGS